LLLFAAAVASICVGITLPIMNVVFGKYSGMPTSLIFFPNGLLPGQMVGAFGAHYNPRSGETEAEFTAVINKNVYDFLSKQKLDEVDGRN